jgi:hypothetical protein
MSDNDVNVLTLVIAYWFDQEHWIIEHDNKGPTNAVMPSGYGSGPATINIRALAKFLHEHRRNTGD